MKYIKINNAHFFHDVKSWTCVLYPCRKSSVCVTVRNVLKQYTLLTQKRLMIRDVMPIVSKMLYDTAREDHKNLANLEEEEKLVRRSGFDVATCVLAISHSAREFKNRSIFVSNDTNIVSRRIDKSTVLC